MFRWLGALIDAWREQREDVWRDKTRRLKTDREIERIMDEVTDSRIQVIKKEAELKSASAEVIKAKLGGNGNGHSESGTKS